MLAGPYKAGGEPAISRPFGEQQAETLQQAIELTGGAQLIEPAQAMEHALDLAAIHALVLDEQEVGAVAVGLGADEHECCVSPDDTASTPDFNDEIAINADIP